MNDQGATDLRREVDRLREHVAQLRAEFGGDHAETLQAMSELARLLYKVKAWDEARDLLEEVVAARTQQDGATSGDTVRAVHSLGAVLYAMGDYEGARVLQDEVLTTLGATRGDDDLGVILARENLALSLQALGRHQDALVQQERVVAGRQARGAEDDDSLWAASMIGDLKRQAGDLAGAIEVHRRVWAVYQSSAPSQRRLMLQANLAVELARTGQRREGKALIEDAFVEAKRTLSKGEALYRMIRCNRRLLRLRAPRGASEVLLRGRDFRPDD